ncbi:zf-UBP-domain-containing protein [Amylocystis lapponica]|nr:zf-UBP-domain-containing protein [Amylocystis lapponica]
MRGFHIRISLSTSSPSDGTCVPNSLLQPLPSHRPKATTISPSATPVPKDYRFGPIRIDWLDCVDGAMSIGLPKKAGVGKERERRGEPVTATFVPAAGSTKSGSTNLPEGVVHIYRESPKPIEDLHSSLNAPSQPQHASSSSQAPLEADSGIDSTLLSIALLRIIRDSAPNRTEAAEFAEAFNGKQFNSMEPEICHVVRVLSITIDADDPVSQTLFQSSGSMYELPTCPVCLERMDSAVTGLVTVPCAHTFHCACLSKWGDSRCPVCRYSQTLLSSHPTSANTTRSSHPIPFAPRAAAPSHCTDCGSTTNLWICLVCGNIGCGRYGRAHAHAHYTHTTHLYALELETQRVWDYAGDGYVHRLIQNKADGKLVELPSAAGAVGRADPDGAARPGPSAADALTAEKVEAIGIEYSYLLTSQLDSQRTFYEAQTGELRAQVGELRRLVEQLGAEVEQGQTAAREGEAARRAEQEAQIAQLRGEMQKAERRAEKATELARTVAKELREERAVGEGLMNNLRAAKEQAEQAQREKGELQEKIKELEDQLRDVMFFLEAKSKIESGDGPAKEAAGGSIELGSRPEQKSSTKKKRGG